MKTTLLLLSALTTSQSFALGFRCESNCIAVDSDNDTVYLLGSIKKSGSERYFKKSDLYDSVSENCFARASQIGLVGILVDHLSFSQNHKTTNTSTVSGDSHRSAGYSGSAGISVAAAQIGRRKTLSVSGYVVEQGYAEADDSFSESHTHTRKTQLSMDPTFSTQDSSCHDDTSITSDEAPLSENDGMGE